MDRVDNGRLDDIGRRLSGPAWADFQKQRLLLTDPLLRLLATEVGVDLAGFESQDRELRAGLATSVAKAGATERMIMKTTRHRSEAMVRRYIQSGTIFEDSAGHFLTKL
jgi:hypothetical protein